VLGCDKLSLKNWLGCGRKFCPGSEPFASAREEIFVAIRFCGNFSPSKKLKSFRQVFALNHVGDYHLLKLAISLTPPLSLLLLLPSNKRSKKQMEKKFLTVACLPSEPWSQLSIGAFFQTEVSFVCFKAVLIMCVFCFVFLVSDPVCLSSSSALHFFQLFFLGPPPC
jgi:hypothetical protein